MAKPVQPTPGAQPRCYPMILPGSTPGAGSGAPALKPARRRANSEGEALPGSQDPIQNALLAATSLFLMARDTLKQAWLRNADIASVGRDLAPRKAQDRAHAQMEFVLRRQQLSKLVELVGETATGRKLLACLQTISTDSKDGDCMYLRQNQSDIKAERKGDKTALRDSVLTARAQRMVDAILEQFDRDPLTPALRLVLHTCDHLLVHWYQESRKLLEKPHERPDPAFLDQARRGMAVSVLVTYGLMKLAAQAQAPHAMLNMTAVAGAAMRRINVSPRIATLLRRSAMRMAEGLKSAVHQGQAETLRYEAMAHRLVQQKMDPTYCSGAWRWLRQVQDVLGMPGFLRPIFERTALDSGKLAQCAANLKQIDLVTLAEWVVSASGAATQELASQSLAPSQAELAELLVLQDKLLWLDELRLRSEMAGFE